MVDIRKRLFTTELIADEILLIMNCLHDWMQSRMINERTRMAEPLLRRLHRLHRAQRLKEAAFQL